MSAEDGRVEKLEKRLRTIETKIATSTSSSKSDEQASIRKLDDHKYVVCKTRCNRLTYDKLTQPAVSVWRDWDITSSKPDVAETAKLLMNPCSVKFLSSRRSKAGLSDMPRAVYEHWRSMGRLDLYYRPFIDGNMIGVDDVHACSDNSETSDDE